MSNFELFIAGQRLTGQDLSGMDRPPDFNGLPPYARASLDFCQQWMQGVESFTVKTSGSTGPPKSTSLTRRQMTTSAEMTAAALGLKAGDRALICLSCQHIAGLMMLVRGMHIGFRLYVVRPAANPLAELRRFYTGLIDFAAFVPLQVASILSGKHAEQINILDTMKAVLIGGAPITRHLYAEVLQIRSPVYQTFGMTETATHFALRRLNGKQRSERYSVLPGVKIGTDERDCLTVRSPVTNGLWLTTNDVVTIVSERQFVWLGRFDNVINSGGFKVQPERIERLLSEIQPEFDVLHHRRFFVAPLADENLGQRVVVVFDGQPLPAETEGKIMTRLRRSLQKYEVPKETVYIRDFIETGNGKIDRAATLAKRGHDSR